MLMNFENHFCNSNKYEKAKYRLYINGTINYSFVTTSRPEDECVDILFNKIKIKNNNSVIRYKITKNKNGVELLLKKGSVTP